MIGRPAWLPTVKFDSCNNLLVSFCVLSICLLNENIIIIIIIIFVVVALRPNALLLSAVIHYLSNSSFLILLVDGAV